MCASGGKTLSRLPFIHFAVDGLVRKLIIISQPLRVESGLNYPPAVVEHTHLVSRCRRLAAAVVVRRPFVLSHEYWTQFLNCPFSTVLSIGVSLSASFNPEALRVEGSG